MKAIHEVIMAGFDGSSDDTDDLVLWVEGTREDLDRIVVGSGAALGEIVKDADPSDVDYLLPKDADKLTERVNRASSAPRL